MSEIDTKVEEIIRDELRKIDPSINMLGSARDPQRTIYWIHTNKMPKIHIYVSWNLHDDLRDCKNFQSSYGKELIERLHRTLLEQVRPTYGPELHNPYISKLIANRFKSLKSLNIKLPRFCAFAGPNNAGKSNIIDIFRFIFDRTGKGLSWAMSCRGGMEEVFWKGKEKDTLDITLEVEASDDSDDNEKQWKWIYEIEILSGKAPDIKKELLTLHSDQEERIALEATETVLKIYNSQSDKGFNPISPIVIEWLHTLGMNEFNLGFHFARYVQNWGIYQFAPQAMKQEAPAIVEPILQGLGDNLVGRLYTMRGNFPKVFSKIEDILRRYFSVNELLLIPTSDGKVVMKWSESPYQTPISYVNMPDGALKFIALLCLIYDPSPPPLMIFEEIENFLHPGLIDLVMDEMRETSQRCQILLTTHSPVVLNCLKPEDVFLVEKGRERGETHSWRIEDIEDLRKLAQDPELRLGDLHQGGHLRRAF